MEQHDNQKQHRVPNVYLKQFGFERDGAWYITVIDKTTDILEDVQTSRFSTTVNEFDFPSDDYSERKHYETTAGLIEGMYRTVLNTIANQKQLIPRHEDVLRHFVSSLICRSEHYVKFFNQVLSDPTKRKRFVEEIRIFDKRDDPDAIETALDLLQPRYKVPLVRGIIGNHIVRVLRSFKALILKSPSGETFTTSDVPVCIDYYENFAWIIPPEAEIYLPLSKEHCLFLYNDKVPPSENPLRKLPHNKIHILNMDDFFGIGAMIVNNGYKKVVVPPQYRERIEKALADGAFSS